MRRGRRVQLRAYGVIGLTVLWFAGCVFDPSGSAVEPGEPDADAGALLCDWSYAPVAFDPCDSPDQRSSLTLDEAGVYVYDTDSGSLTAPDTTQTVPPSTIDGGARVLWLDGFYVGASSTLRSVGAAPLVVAVFGDAAIAGGVDASSQFDGDAVSTGSGANPGGCPSSPPTAGQTCLNHGGSGGGGAAFLGGGGDGGAAGVGHQCNGDGIAGGLGGSGASFSSATTTVRGGCPGREGAPNDEAPGTPSGGAGGGAIALSVRDTLTVSGTIAAGGAGGDGCFAGNRAGGGGGGSGGMVVLEATQLSIDATAILAANGGGGGGGCDHGVGSRGTDGTVSSAPADGGPAEAVGTGGAGGAGGALAAPAGELGETAERGGGGGGGGAGYVVLRGELFEDQAAVISPAAIVN